MRCRHENASDKYGETTHDRIGDIIYEVEYRECLDCGAWLPLGHSDETPVAIEVRAAELFACENHGADKPAARCRCYHQSHLLPDPLDEAEARRLYREMWEVGR